MALVRPLTEDDLEPALRDQVQFFKGPLGVIPTTVRAMAHRGPNISRGEARLAPATGWSVGKHV